MNEQKELKEKLVFLLKNLNNFKQIAKNYEVEYLEAEQHNQLKSVATDKIIDKNRKTINKSMIDIIQKKDYYYDQYLKYSEIVNDINCIISILADFEREILVYWYTTPKTYRKKAEDYSFDIGVSRGQLFKIIKNSNNKMIEFYGAFIDKIYKSIKKSY